MESRLVIPARFNGPPGSGNGGYSCGVLGTLIGEGAEVTLRAPPPLDRELSVETEESDGERRLRMMDGEKLIATGRAAEPDVTVPDPPTAALAREAERAYAWRDEHPFPTCFVCGPARAPGDGLRLFTGKVEGRNLVASAWTPSASVGTADGTVEPAVAWSAVDCPTYFGTYIEGGLKMALLGRLTAKLVRRVMVGEPHIVVGWPLGRDGRKWEGGAAVFTAEGELCVFARGLWVELKQ